MTSFFGSRILPPLLGLCLLLAFALMTTLFHWRRLRRKHPDLVALILYFSLFFSLFLVLPCGLMYFLGAPHSLLPKVGLTMGAIKRGVSLLVLGIPLSTLGSYIGSRDAELARFYPFAPSACTRWRRFIGYEVAYFFLYYTSWEFLYRGLLFFPLLSVLGLPAALGLQTILSTLHHLGHPPLEILSAFFAGILFGLIAWTTGSILYTILIHGLIGISTDFFICRRRRLQPS